MYLQKVYNESFLQGSSFTRDQPEAPTGEAICPGQIELAALVSQKSRTGTSQNFDGFLEMLAE